LRNSGRLRRNPSDGKTPAVGENRVFRHTEKGAKGEVKKRVGNEAPPERKAENCPAAQNEGKGECKERRKTLFFAKKKKEGNQPQKKGKIERRRTLTFLHEGPGPA